MVGERECLQFASLERAKLHIVLVYGRQMRMNLAAPHSYKMNKSLLFTLWATFAGLSRPAQHHK
jgi:hypothetical protein